MRGGRAKGERMGRRTGEAGGGQGRPGGVEGQRRGRGPAARRVPAAPLCGSTRHQQAPCTKRGARAGGTDGRWRARREEKPGSKVASPLGRRCRREPAPGAVGRPEALCGVLRRPRRGAPTCRGGGRVLRGSRSFHLAVPLILAAPTARLDPSARQRAEAAAEPHAGVGSSDEQIVGVAARAAVAERPKPSRAPE